MAPLLDTDHSSLQVLDNVLNEQYLPALTIKQQILKNSALRILLRKPKEIPMTTPQESKQQSVLQLVAYHTANHTYKV